MRYTSVSLSFSELVQHFINGLTLGSIYALIALGYTMVYGVLKFINFAHGEILMAGTYVGMLVYNRLNPGNPAGGAAILFFAVSILVASMFSAALGVTIERWHTDLSGGTKACSAFKCNRCIYCSYERSSPDFWNKIEKFHYPFDNSAFNIGGIAVTPHQIMILLVRICLMASLKIFVDRTSLKSDEGNEP